ncbi:MAG: hypothetical protein GXO26_01270 [Crenarchaeota archaeon]|nr:hypothetical protein [Thermoproteota archaeon]
MKRLDWGIRISKIDVRKFLTFRFNKSIEDLLNSYSIPEIVINIAKSFGILLTYLVERWNLENRRILFIVDEIKKILEYRGLTINELITSLYDGRGIRQELGLKDLTYLIMTNQLLIEDVLREVGRCWIYLMWHLDLDNALTLCKNLNMDDSDLIIKLTGGCPGAIFDIRQVGLDKWIESIINHVKSTVFKIMMELGISFSEVKKNLDKIINNVDTLEIGMRVRRILIRENLMIYMISTQISKIIKDLWIGKSWSWQMSIYYHVIKTICDKGLDISGESLLNGIC